MSNYHENMNFEAEVRRAAEAVWNVPPGQCQPKRYLGDLSVGEIDGVVYLRDVTHLLMVTTSSKLEKVKEDVKKLKAAERIERKAGISTSFLGWLITEKQLDPLHVKHAVDAGVRVMTLFDFKRRCFDGSKYISLRQQYPFGSAVHPRDGSFALEDQKYVDLPLLLEAKPPQRPADKGVSADYVIDGLLRGEIFVLLAPFGAGKSFTAREMFQRLAKRFTSKDIDQAPVVLNLRDHWGEDYGDEILERHARAIAFTPKEELTIGWRANLVTMLLDGFDEIASQVVARSDDRDFLRQARRSALKGIRDLITKTPGNCGLLVSGRDHYFDDESELAHALGLLGRPYNIVRVGEFNEAQAAEFLKNNQVNLPLPDWLPRKPLLLGYLAYRGLLEDVLKIEGDRGYGFVWDKFLDLVCEREASLATSMMDSATLRLVLENLALGVRSTSSGTGPLAQSDLIQAYRQVAGQSPTDPIIAQLQRLPGLTERGQTQGTRSFVDEDFLAALQGSAVARYILHGAEMAQTTRLWLEGLSIRGLDTAAYLLEKENASASVAISRAQSAQRQGLDGQLVADCIAVALNMTKDGSHIDCLNILIQGAELRRIDLEEYAVEGLELRDCNIDEVLLGGQVESSTLAFRGCLIGKVSGVASKEGLPKQIFQEGCEVRRFDNLSTNNAVVKSDLPPRVKALVTILRKLYFQSGSGRKLAAFHRGIPPGPVSKAIDEVLRQLEKEGLVSIFNKIAHPVRKQADRVSRILRAPTLSDDPLVIKLREAS
jgi:hypothetical protein